MRDAVRALLAQGYDLDALERLAHEALLVRQAVGIREFIESKEFLDAGDAIYPVIMDELERMCSGQYREVILSGGIGSGKSTAALYAQLYQIYLLSCYKNPHLLFSLDPSSEIIVVVQGPSLAVSRNMINRFREMVKRSRYFARHFPHDRNVESELRFPFNIVMKSATGNATGIIGQNVIGGCLEELNFMEVVEHSRKSPDGHVYSQARTLYEGISRRIKSRFSTHGRAPGLLCLVSSRRLPDDFTEQRIREAANDVSVYVYDRTVWEVKPKGSFSAKTFRVYCGTPTEEPRILGDDEQVAGEVVEIPEDFRPQFQGDIYQSLRDIAGRATRSSHPYFTDFSALKAAFGRIESILEQDSIVSGDPVEVLVDRIKHPKEPRYIHVDLALTGDSAGFAMCHCPGFVSTPAGERMPQIRFDCVLRIQPPKHGAIDFARIRQIIDGLRRMVPIKWVSLDSFQSADFIQQIRRRGMASGILSLDRSTLGYDMTRDAMHDGRLLLPSHDILLREMSELVLDVRRGKVDHLPGRSKDCADAAAGALLGLSQRREIWARHGAQPSNALVELIRRNTVEAANAVESARSAIAA